MLDPLCFSRPGGAKTPEILWKCAVDRGQTGPDLLEETRPGAIGPAAINQWGLSRPLGQPLQTHGRIKPTAKIFLYKKKNTLV